MRFSDFRPLLNGASCIGYDNDYRIGGGAEEEDRGHLLKGSYRSGYSYRRLTLLHPQSQRLGALS